MNGLLIVDDDAFVSASLKIILEYAAQTLPYLQPEQMATMPSPCTIHPAPMFC